MSYEEAYGYGYQAFSDGKFSWDNPFIDNAEEDLVLYKAWLDGYNDCKEIDCQ